MLSMLREIQVDKVLHYVWNSFLKSISNDSFYDLLKF